MSANTARNSATPHSETRTRQLVAADPIKACFPGVVVAGRQRAAAGAIWQLASACDANDTEKRR